VRVRQRSPAATQTRCAGTPARSGR
jgi:hypothetical protein